MSDSHIPTTLSRLASRLSADAEADCLALSSSDPLEAVSTLRSSTTRELLRASPVAARRLRQIAESGSDKDAIAAANIILTKSPASPAPNLSPSGASFSAEALEVLFRGLASFASSAGLQVRAPDFAEATIIEDESEEQ